MCLRSTLSMVSLPSSGNTNFWTSQRPLAMVRGLQRTSTCSTKYRCARSATVGVSADFTAGCTGSSPALMRAIIWAALRRAWSADTTPWRPTAIHLDFPVAQRKFPRAHGQHGRHPASSAVIDAVANAPVDAASNHGGFFENSRNGVASHARAHGAMADFLNARS